MTLLPARTGGRTVTTRAYPFREVEDVYDRMGQLLSSAFGDLGRAVEDMPWSPQADICETDEAYVLTIDVPGVRKDQIDVQVHDRDVVVTGEVTRREQGRWFRRTRPAGRFEYRATLPGDINPDKIGAELSDGVLTVTVPKAETAKPRRIEITA
jgi:HSP20 family protein